MNRRERRAAARRMTSGLRGLNGAEKREVRRRFAAELRKPELAEKLEAKVVHRREGARIEETESGLAVVRKEIA